MLRHDDVDDAGRCHRLADRMTRREVDGVDRALAWAMKYQRRRLDDCPGLGVKLHVAADLVADDVLRRLRVGAGAEGEDTGQDDRDLHNPSCDGR
jgi:hypothetical protein